MRLIYALAFPFSCEIKDAEVNIKLTTIEFEGLMML